MLNVQCSYWSYPLFKQFGQMITLRIAEKGSSFVYKILNGQEYQTEGSIDLRLVCFKVRPRG